MHICMKYKQQILKNWGWKIFFGLYFPKYLWGFMCQCFFFLCCRHPFIWNCIVSKMPEEHSPQWNGSTATIIFMSKELTRKIWLKPTLWTMIAIQTGISNKKMMMIYSIKIAFKMYSMAFDAYFTSITKHIGTILVSFNTNNQSTYRFCQRRFYDNNSINGEKTIERRGNWMKQPWHVQCMCVSKYGFFS